MDHKAWLWRKKSAEKTIASSEKIDLSVKGFEEQVDSFATDKEELEKDFKELNDKLSSVLSDCNTKDNLLKKHEMITQEAIAGQEKAESEAMSLKKQLDECLKQRISCEERIVHLDLALKECAQQLRFVREEQERRIHDAVIKASREFEKSQLLLEEKLEETSKRLAKTIIENAHLSQSLLTKEKVIDDLNRQRGQVEADFNALMSRLDSMEKDNASLKYEVRVLEKELEIRNEEREFNRRTADASHRQHLESVKQIAKLESECQRLRLLVRKRLPGPAAVAKMKNEAEILGRRKSNGGLPLDFGDDHYPETPTRRINVLAEQIISLEEENKNLKEALNKKANELKQSRMAREVSLASMSDMGSDDKASCAESWASALISELEHFKNEKHKESRKFGASDINLMDDFAEMERLAVISVDETPKSQLSYSGQTNAITEVSDSLDTIISKLPTSLKSIVELVLKQNQRDPDEILEDIKMALEPKIQQEPPCIAFNVDINKSVSKIIELIEGINFPSQKNGTFPSNKNSETATGYMVRVFQWKTSELAAIMQQFLHTCYDLLSEKAEMTKFAQELVFALEWVLNHCFSLQDVSTMRNEMMKHFDWDDHSEAEIGLKEQKARTEESLRSQCRESESTIERLRNEINELNESKKTMEGQVEDYKSTIDDLNRQLLVTKAELNEAREEFSSLEVELENKKSCCEELENTCLELQLQLESVIKSDIPADAFNEEEKKPQSNWEITAASEKLAECQETILNLGKQLKALASPREAALFDKVVPSTATVSPPPNKSTTHRSSLLDQMIAEDNAKAKVLKTSDGKPSNGNIEPVQNGLAGIQEKLNGIGTPKAEETPSLAVVTAKNGSKSFWSKLLWRTRKGKSKKTSLPHAL